jgi:hypothetical protein
MNGHKVKQTKRLVRKYEGEIKIEGLKEFIAYAKKKNIRERLKLAWRIIVKSDKI